MVGPPYARGVHTPLCPSCRRFVYLDAMACESCGTEIGYHLPTLTFHEMPPGGTRIDGVRWLRCLHTDDACNWLVAQTDDTGECFACRLVLSRPGDGDTEAHDRLAPTRAAERRLLVQLLYLGLPITPYWEREGGLAFDFRSSSDGQKVFIGHANGVITMDLAESLSDYRESLRIALGEPYRTLLGHFRHEVGHYFQNVLLDTDELWEECRALFGDERASYSDALDRHYRAGAPADWHCEHISEYATMHPWEDFAECFAHYLHISATLATSAAAGLELSAARYLGVLADDLVPQLQYTQPTVGPMLQDWDRLAFFFNRVNRAMGLPDLYPFTFGAPVARKLDFVHRVIRRHARQAVRGTAE